MQNVGEYILQLWKLLSNNNLWMLLLHLTFLLSCLGPQCFLCCFCWIYSKVLLSSHQRFLRLFSMYCCCLKVFGISSSSSFIFSIAAITVCEGFQWISSSPTKFLIYDISAFIFLIYVNISYCVILEVKLSHCFLTELVEHPIHLYSEVHFRQVI